MIGLPAGVKVFLACGRTDMRKGMSGLAMQARRCWRRTRFGPRFLLQGPPRRFNQGALLGYAGAVPIRQTSGERTLHLALAGGWGSAADSGAAVDAVGGDRLTGAAADLASGSGGLRRGRLT